MRLSSSASDWLQILRTRTAASHRAIERQPLLKPLGAGDCSHDDYVNALRALAAPQMAMETSTAEYSAKNNDPLAEYQPLQRMPWLSNDLMALSAKPFELTTIWPECSTPAAYIGILYVREGSRFGAQVIARRLTQLLPNAASSFFSLTSAPQWPAFIENASHYAPDVEAVAEVATNVFEALRIHLDRVFVQKLAFP